MEQDDSAAKLKSHLAGIKERSAKDEVIDLCPQGLATGSRPQHRKTAP